MLGEKQTSCEYLHLFSLSVSTEDFLILPFEQCTFSVVSSSPSDSLLSLFFSVSIRCSSAPSGSSLLFSIYFSPDRSPFFSSTFAILCFIAMNYASVSFAMKYWLAAAWGKGRGFLSRWATYAMSYARRTKAHACVFITSRDFFFFDAR
jgi:hypothetical protein